MPLKISTTLWTTSGLVDTILTQLRPYHWYIFDAAVVCAAIWTFLQSRRTSRHQTCTTQLRGPPSESFLYGAGKHILSAKDPGALYMTWAQEYGSAYMIPLALGSKRVVLCDPKAIAHFYAKKTWTYVQIPVNKLFFAKFFGKGVLWAEGECHQRHRRSLTPALSIPAVRQLTPIFYESAYKAKGAWDALIESDGVESTLIEVENWMNHIALDIIGLAGFSHNFGALEGEHAPITEALDALSSSHRSTGNKSIYLLGQALPLFTRVPTSRGKVIRELCAAMDGISNALLARTQKELEMGVVGGKEERSIIGMLVNGGNRDSESHLTKEEVVAQIRTLLIGGYETISISLTWGLLELSRNLDVQTKLRNELLEHGADPTYDELTNGLPYLDAVVHEILRLHPAVPDTEGQAIEDDVIPLSEPVRTKSGALVDSLMIAKGTIIYTYIESINRSSAIWGVDASVFRPSRWLEDGHGQNGISTKANEIQGYRHLLTFVDGQRMCPGRYFAISELKAVLTVLVKNFVFELRDGVGSKIDIGAGMLPRPKMAGEMGCKLPLHVRSYGA